MDKATREAWLWFDCGYVESGTIKPPEAVADPNTPQCDRCDSLDYRDTPIHGGRSIRRDCVKCGRFISFPKWHEKTLFKMESIG